MKRSPEKYSESPNKCSRLAIITLLCSMVACSPTDKETAVEDGLSDIKERIIRSYFKGQERRNSRLAALKKVKEQEEEDDSEIEIPFCRNLSGHVEPGKMPKKMQKKKKKKKRKGEPAQVVCAVDGDTFDVKLEDHDDAMIRVRIWGTDCEESSENDKCMKQGKSKCEEEMKKGKKVANKVRRMLGDGEVTLKPPYKVNGNRVLAYMHLKNGVDLGRSLVSSCLCEEGYKHARKKDYKKAGKRCK